MAGIPRSIKGRSLLVLTIGKFGETGWPHLKAIVNDTSLNGGIRTDALQGIFKLDRSRWFPLIPSLLDDKEPMIRGKTLRHLAGFPDDVVHYKKQILESLADKNVYVDALDALTVVETTLEEILVVLENLKHADEIGIHKIADALIRTFDSNAIDVVFRLLTDQDVQIREAAEVLLGIIDNREAELLQIMPKIVGRLQSLRVIDLIEGCAAVRALGSRAQTAIHYLTPLKTHFDSNVRMAADSALTAISLDLYH